MGSETDPEYRVVKVAVYGLGVLQRVAELTIYASVWYITVSYYFTATDPLVATELSHVELLQRSPAEFALATALGLALGFGIVYLSHLLSRDEKEHLRRVGNAAMSRIAEAQSTAESTDQDEEPERPDRGWNQTE